MKLSINTIRKSVAAAIAASAAVLAAVPAASASTVPAAPAARTVQMAGGVVATVQTYTGSQTALLPALPKGHHWGSTVTVRHITLPKDYHSAVTPAAVVHPDSASGCTPYNGAVAPYTCIVVTGSGLNEEAWYTGTYISNPDATAYYEANGLTVLWDVYSDAPFGQYFTDLPGYGPETWANGTKLCNWWSGSAAGSAMPCITIKG